MLDEVNGACPARFDEVRWFNPVVPVPSLGERAAVRGALSNSELERGVWIWIWSMGYFNWRFERLGDMPSPPAARGETGKYGACGSTIGSVVSLAVKLWLGAGRLRSSCSRSISNSWPASVPYVTSGFMTNVCLGSGHQRSRSAADGSGGSSSTAVTSLETCMVALIFSNLLR